VIGKVRKETLLAAVANSPEWGGSKSKSNPSRQSMGTMLNIPKGSIDRKMKRAEEKRQALKMGVGKERWWSYPKKRKVYKKVSYFRVECVK
jgi:cell division protein FtsN